jgi:carbonic anhydrase
MKLILVSDRGRLSGLPFAVVFASLVFLPMSDAVAADKESESGSPLVHYYFSKGAQKHEAEWGYTGKQGPQFWGTLSPKYHLANDGKQQSPIDIQIKDAIAESLPPLKFNYRKERISAINNGHSIQHNEQPGSFLHVGKHRYSLEQYHVHVPSEHTIDGKHADMEIHFVHKSSSGKIAVVAVMAYADSKNPVNAPLYKELPKQVGESAVADQASRNPAEIIPKDHSYLQYMGSFTTPPCTEGIRWFMMKTPISITPEVLTEFKGLIGGNNRPVQQLNDREVFVTSATHKAH